ncbi:copper resistance CopC/CopD family protein [Actinoplanes aureus]|uniref:copper resistance CopC/CopD family protein n=1 Tax=Actinoplanes aureus TaxID=2792083 RepID=UPI0028158164|nr:copper resistance protein CopC [Actinoplanes aureus]
MTRVRNIPLLLLFAVLGVLFLPAVPASAHATPVSSDPVPGSVVGASPSVVTVTFSEPIAVVSGRIQVIAPDGERINGTPTVEGAVLRIPVRKPGRPLGTYLISFRVISADSHPVGGAITFSVGAPSERPEAATSTGPHWSVAAAIPTLKFTGYAGLTLIAGPALFLAFLWPPRRSRRSALITVRTGIALTAVATVGALGLQAQQGSGSALWQVSAGELGEVLTSQFGLLLTIRLAVLAVLAALLPRLLRGPRRTPAIGPSPAPAPARELVPAGGPALTLVSTDAPALITVPRVAPTVVQPRAHRAQVVAVLLLAVAGLVTWPLTGHAAAAPMPAVTVAVGVVHMAAMAIWIGGLITLIAFLLRGTHRRVLAKILPVWSRWAAMSVLWLAIAGGVQSAVQLGSLEALWRTGYGQLLLAKLGVLALVLGAAAVARKLVLTARNGGVLRRTVGIEVVATVVILALSAVLVQVDPGRTAAVKDNAISGRGSSDTLDSPIYALQFNIYPVELGEYNTVHAFLYSPSGAPLRAAEWQLTARLLDQDLEAVPQPIAGLDAPSHQALGSVTFPLPGTYELAFTIRTSEIDRATVKTTVTVER